MAWRIYEHRSKAGKLYWTVEDRSGSTRSPVGKNGGQSLYFKREDAERERNLAKIDDKEDAQ